MAEINVLNLKITSGNAILQAHNGGAKEFEEQYKGILDRIDESERGELLEDSINNVINKYLEAAEYIDLSSKADDDNNNNDEEESASDDDLSQQENSRLNELKAKFNNKTADEVAREFGGQTVLENIKNNAKKSDRDRIVNMLKTYDKITKQSPEKAEAMKESFNYLYSVSEHFHQHREMNPETTVEFNNKQLMLVVRNLYGTGLNFTIDSNKALVMSKENALTQEQVDALGKFMADDGGLRGKEDFDFKNTNSLKVKNADGNEQPFEDAFSKSLNQANADRGKDEETWSQEAFEEWCRENGLTGNEPGVKEAAKSEKGLKLDREAFKDKIKARMNLAGFNDPRLIKTRYCLDGSMILTCYTTENDMYDDMTTKDGLRINRKKAFSVKMKYKNGMPVVSYYLPPGKPLEGGHARIMLEALKSQGCTHAYLPNGMITGGKGQGAIWEAVAKSRICPMALPDGNELTPQNIVDIMETLKKENDPDRKEIIAFKKNLLEQLEIQERHKQKRDGAEYSLNSNLNIQMEQLRGSIEYDVFNAGGLPGLQKFIANHAQKRTAGENQWDKITVLAATAAVSDIIENYSILREKYNDHDLTEKQLQFELMQIMNSGVRDKEGNAITSQGTLSDVKAMYADFRAKAANNNEEKRSETAINNVTKAITSKMKATIQDVETDKSVKLSYDPNFAISSAKIPGVAEVKNINMKDIVAKTFQPSR